MKNIVKKIKEIASEKNSTFTRFGNNPLDPWSTKYGIAEDAMLDQYLKSIGLDPTGVEKYQKSGYIRSDAFKEYKKKMMGEEYLEEKNKDKKNKTVPKPRNPVVPAMANRGGGGSHKPKGKKYKGGMRPGDERTELHPSEKSTKTAASEISSRASRQKPVPTPRPERSHFHEDLDESNQICWTGYKRVPGTKKYTKGSCVKKEDIENILEISDETRKSYLQKSKQTVRELKPYAKGEYGDIAKNIITRRKKGIDLAKRTMKKEDKFQDPQAATQTVGMEVENKGSRALRVIKRLRRPVKEDMYDHEKEDKSIQTYGKKPKFEKVDKKDAEGEKKSNSAATLSGGKTLTGEPRDTIEIDPIMRVRPGQPDPTKDKDKKKDENKKKDEKK